MSAGLLLSTASTLAASEPGVYRVVGLEGVRGGWSVLRTTTGLEVFVRCASRAFDDVKHDYVAGFASTEECEAFLATIEAHASAEKPVTVEINSRFRLDVTVAP